MTTIAQVAVAFKNADPGSLIRAAQEEGGKAGTAAGQSFGSSFAKVGSAAASGLLGIATKQLLDMDGALAKFKSETGATAAEVQSASAAMNAAYKSHVQSLTEIGDTLGQLRTQMGLSQEEANKMLDPFLEFAQVTGQAGPDAVRAFDDILDNWNLTAERSKGLMDQLILSHQKYGGSIADNEKTLAALAPAMKAANLQIDDGIALLNLFGAKGLDAEVASAAFSKALTKVKSPAELQTAIADIAGTKDGFERASKAADLFGARAGAKLANALGDAKLDDYKVSIEQAAGATDKAADDINSSITTKIQLALHEFIGTVAGFAAPAGPVLTGTAAVVSGIAAIGRQLGIEAGTAALKWAAILGPLGLAALVAGTAAVALNEAYQQQAEAGRKAAAAGGGGFDALNSRLAEYHRQLQVIENDHHSGAISADTYDAAIAKIKAEYPDLAAGAQVMGASTDELAARWRAASSDVGASTDELAARWRAAADSVTTSGSDLEDALLGQFKGVTQSGSDLEDALLGQFGRVGTSMKRLGGMAKEIGYDTLQGLADGITAARQQPLDAMDKLLEAMKHPLSQTAETARLIGELTSKKLAEGMSSADPAIRAQAAATRESIIARLEEITPRAGTVSKKAMDELAAGMRSKDPVVAAAATEIYNTVKHEMDLSSQAKGWATATGDAYAAALRALAPRMTAAAQTALGGVPDVFEAHSPPGPKSPLHEIDKWGERTGLAWVDAFIAALETADGRSKLTLGKVQSSFASFVKSYQGVTGLMPAASPEAQRTSLREYIANLTKELATTSDPAERNRIEDQIADYTGRLKDLIGKVGTANEKAIDTLRGYIGTLDKAMLTETDPRKRQQILDEITDYRLRIDRLSAGTPAAATVPQANTAVDSSGNPAGHYNHVGDSWLWVPNVEAGTPTVPVASVGDAASSTNPMLLNNGQLNPNYGAGLGPTNHQQNSIVINNPKAERASDDITKTMALLGQRF